MKRIKYLLLILLIPLVTFAVSAEEIPAQTESEPRQKIIALTFDDGPHPKYTKLVLDILEEKNVPATFFVVGFRAALHHAALERMVALGCEIGNHTYDHLDLTEIPAHKAIAQIALCSAEIKDATGRYPTLYRPPFGKIGGEAEKDIALTKVLWTIDSNDWCTKQAWKISARVTKNAHDGGIILMHDFYESSLDALPVIIDALTEQGYRFVTVSELLKISQ